mgnify:CR=1 FL=1
MNRFLILATIILTSCSEHHEQIATQIENATEFLGESVPEGFARVTSQRIFQFPEDHGSHEDYQNEWWYITGNLEASQQRHFGFELTFFRYGLNANTTPRKSEWAANHAWMGHLAVTDSQNNEFVAVERFSRQALKLAGAQTTPFKVWLEDWFIYGNKDNIWPLSVNANSERVGLNLTLNSKKPAVSHGDGGVDQKGPEKGNASHYYSFTRLDAKGTVRIDERSYQVSGSAWMDREWGTSSLSPDIAGWDWFGLQLSDEREFMYYRLRTNDGQSSPYSGGSIILPDGERLNLNASDVFLEPLKYWTSPETGATYPTSWQISIPQEEMTLTVNPYLDKQELNLTVRYWEGAMKVNGIRKGQSITGQGYTELTGY